jgi:hypothetical protein
VPSDDPDHLRAQRQVALQLLAAEVEPAVPKPKRLVHVLLVELERKRRRARDDLELVDGELHVPGSHPRVDGLGRARDDLAARSEDELVADLARELGGGGGSLRVDDELRDPGAVAEVDEHEPAVVAATRNPARKGDGPADVVGARLAAHEVSPAHGESLETISSWPSTSSGAPEVRSVAASPPTTTTAAAWRRRACVSCPFSDRPA